MDNDTLSALMHDLRERNYWLKPVGIPEEEPNLYQKFSLPEVRIDFAESPHAIQMRDVVIVYRIGVSKIIYISECASSVIQATRLEIEKDSWRERWSWYIYGKNASPNYGAVWSKFDLRPFALVEKFNRLYPDEKQNIGTIKYGSDKAQISKEFASYIMRRICKL